MEQAQLFHCCDCKDHKPKDQFPVCTKNNKHGAWGELSSRCSSCNARACERCENKKRKRDEEGPDPSGDPAKPNHTISVEEFMELLKEKALTGVISYSSRVSTQGLHGTADEICASIAGRVWEATGFGFTYNWFPLERPWLMFSLHMSVDK
jgi:hypothetical protein